MGPEIEPLHPKTTAEVVTNYRRFCSLCVVVKHDCYRCCCCRRRRPSRRRRRRRDSGVERVVVY